MQLYLENMKKKPSKNSLFSKISSENGSRTVKNPQQNTSKPNPITHKKNYILWPSGTYPRNARLI